MGRKSIETLVGLFVLAGALAVVFLALKAANLASFSTSSTYTVKASFDNIGGLKVRAPVRSAGVTVGRVTAINLDAKSYRGVVTLEISKGIEFPSDSSAKILTAGLLGDQYIGIDPGSEEKMLQQGDSIHLTQSAIVLENLIGQLLFKGASDAGSDKNGDKK